MAHVIERLRDKKLSVLDSKGITGFCRVARVSRRRNYVFANIPKAGGNSVRAALMRTEAYLDGLATEPEDMAETRENAFFLRHNVDPAFPKALPQSLKEGFAFTIVRNPFSRALSAYHEKVVKTYRMIAGDPAYPEENLKRRKKRLADIGLDQPEQPTLEDFLDAVSRIPPSMADQHFAPQSYLLAIDVIPYDFMGYIENYEAAMDGLSERLFDQRDAWRRAEASFQGQRNVNYKGGGAPDRVKQEYTPQAIERVQQYYARDFKALGYSPNLRDVGEAPAPMIRAGRRPAVPSLALFLVSKELALKNIGRAKRRRNDRAAA